MLFTLSFSVFLFGLNVVEPPILHVAMYTNWGLHVANISLLFSFLAGLDAQKKNYELKRTATFMNALAVSAQVVVVALYWPILHTHVVDIAKEHAETDPSYA